MQLSLLWILLVLCWCAVIKRDMQRWRTGFVKLTEVHGKILGVFNHGLQHDSGDQLDAVFGLLCDEPLQYFLLFVQGS